jgi:hypothetical protein
VGGDCRYVTIQSLQRQRAKEWWGVITLRYFPEGSPIAEVLTRLYEIGRAGPYATEQACAAALASLEKATIGPIEQRTHFAAVVDRSECLPQHVSY